MSLKTSLENLTGVDQLPALVVELGFAAAWHPIPPPAGGDRLTALVGRRAGLLAMAESSPDPARSVRRLTGNLADRGVNAVVFSLDSDRRLLAVSATGAEFPVALIDLQRVRSVDERILERGRGIAAGSSLEAALAWAEAIGGQSLGQRFFVEFRRQLEAARALLPGKIPLGERHGLALLALIRVLFLYFVQERGWLDGRRRFLREEVDRCLGGHGHLDAALLRPLFFGTLNRSTPDRSSAVRRFGRIPFLNGGLFEPHPLERRWRVGLPDEFWIDAFDDLFERFHFTVAESADRGAIAPDMLGRVFEGVMDPEERRGTGAFYTPSHLVDQLVDRTLGSWLEARHPGGSTSLTDPAMIATIREITVLDPAVGSGAFLMGALKRLVAWRVAGGQPVDQATREVVSRNLFGVDINPHAVRLTELRLWLAVIQADQQEAPDQVAPLPNLDSLIRQGDSIIEPAVLPFAVRGEDASAVAALRRAVVGSTGPAKRGALVALRRAELRAARAGLEAARASLEGHIREALSAARSPGLFGDRAGLGRRGAAQLRRLRSQRAALRGIERRLTTANELPWFHYGTHFGDLMQAGGFDVVIGNPPWVRAEALSLATRTALKARYRWFNVSGGSGFRHLPDLSVAFLERAIELTRLDGTVGFLVPAKLLTAQYASAARAGLLRQTIDLVAPLDDRAADFKATVYPLALVIHRRPPAKGHSVLLGFGPGTNSLPQDSLGGGPWHLSDTDSAFATNTAHLPTLGTTLHCRLGVKTGADAVFLDPPLPTDLLRPAVKGRDIKPFAFRRGRRLLWTHDRRGEPLPSIPEVAERYLHRHRSILLRRTDYRHGPYWQVFRTDGALAKHRVVWPDIARQLTAVALVGPDRSVLPLNTCYWTSTADEDAALALAAWLNSSPIRILARGRATVAASGFRRFNADVVSSLPLPASALSDPILRALGAQAHRGSLDQATLDRRVAELLGVSDLPPSP